MRAYENAARTISSLDGDIEQLARDGKLKGQPGLGPTLLKRVDEAIETGNIAFYDELRATTPPIKLDMRASQALARRRSMPSIINCMLKHRRTGAGV